MKTSIINIKTDMATKRDAQRAARALGLPLSAVLNNYLREFSRTKKVIFGETTPKKDTERRIMKALKDYARGKNISPTFATGKAMDEYRHSLK